MRLRDVYDRLRNLKIPRRRYLRQVYRAVFDTEDGCMVLQDLYLFAGVTGGRDSCVFGDPHRTAYNEGRRSVVLYIQNRMRWSEDDVQQLLENGSPPDPLRDPEEEVHA